MLNSEGVRASAAKARVKAIQTGNQPPVRSQPPPSSPSSPLPSAPSSPLMAPVPLSARRPLSSGPAAMASPSNNQQHNQHNQQQNSPPRGITASRASSLGSVQIVNAAGDAVPLVRGAARSSSQYAPPPSPPASFSSSSSPPSRPKSTVSSTSASSPLRISSSSVVSSTSSRRNAVPHSRPTSHGSNSTNASSNSANSANSANSYSSSYSNGGSSQSNYNNNYNNFGNSYAGNGGSVVSNSSGTSRSNGAYRSSSSQGHATAGNGSPGGMAGSLPPYSTSPPSAPSAMSSRSASAVHAAGQYSNAIAGAGASATHNTINAYNSGTYSRSIPPSSAASTPSSSVASAPAPSRPLSVPFSQSQSPYVPGHAGSALSASSSSTAPTVIRTAGGSGRSAAHPSAQSHDRALRKIMDLEIANTSLLSVNSSLERTVRQQSVVIQKLKRQLTRFFNQSLGEQTLNDITDISSQLSALDSPTEPQSPLSSTFIDPLAEPLPLPGQSAAAQHADEKAMDRLCSMVQSLLSDGQRAMASTSALASPKKQPSSASLGRLSAAASAAAKQDDEDEDDDEMDVSAGSGMFYHLPLSHSATALQRQRSLATMTPEPAPAPAPPMPYLDDPYDAAPANGREVRQRMSSGSFYAPPRALGQGNNDDESVLG